MQLGQDASSSPPTALGSDWLLSNGLGGSSCGTASGFRARPAHALLTASLPTGRVVTLLLSATERLHTTNGTVDFARGSGGVVLESFAPAPIPTWVYNAGGVRLERSVFMIAGHNAVAVRWRHLGGLDARLVVSPLVVARGPHELERERHDAPGATSPVPGRVRVQLAAEEPALTLWHNGAFIPARVWRQLDYPELANPDAGVTPGEQAMLPGYLEAMLPAGGSFHLVAGAEEELFRTLAREDRLGSPPPKTLAECVAMLARDDDAQRDAWVARAVEGANETARQARASRRSDDGADAATLLHARDGWTAPLAAQLLSGLTRRPHRLSFVSSLPTSPERGTHVLRAVPALVAVRAFETARELLRGVVEYLDEGVAPEYFTPDGFPRYGDPAPTLWLVHAAELYARRSHDLDFTNRVLAPAVEAAMPYYRMGTRHGIRVDSDGLLENGAPAVKRVEPNILWYHALVAMAQLSKLTGRKEQGAFYLAWARDHQTRFLEAFWDERSGTLYDRLEGDAPQRGFSASQLLAVSLAPAILPNDQAARLVDAALARLVVKEGVREDDASERARPDWLAQFIVAWLRVHGRRHEAQAAVGGWLQALDALRRRSPIGALPGWVELGLGSTTAGGVRIAPDPMSALAAAEVLRAWVEDVEHEPATEASAVTGAPTA